MSFCYECLLTIALLLVVGGAYQLVLGMAGVASTQIAASALWRNLLGLVWVAVLFGYYAWCWRRSGQSLAMRTWRLQLRNRQHELASMRAIALRFAIALLAYLPLIPAYEWVKHMPSMRWVLWLAYGLVALPWLWTLIDRDRQTLHDRLAGTQIVLLPVGTNL